MSVRVLSKEEIKKHNKKIDEWWSNLDYQTKNEIYQFMNNIYRIAVSFKPAGVKK